MLERAQLVGQLVGAEVELLVEGIDLGLVVDALAEPLALGAATPDAPVGAVAGLLPAGRLHQAGAALGADVQFLDRLRARLWLGSLISLLIEPAQADHLIRTIPTPTTTKPHYRVSKTFVCADPVGPAAPLPWARCSETSDP